MLPAVAVAVSVEVCPLHIVIGFPETETVGVCVTEIETVPAALVHPEAEVVVAVYVPLAAVPAPGIVGFCAIEVKLFGPLQL